MNQVHVRTTVNGEDTEFLCEADESLLDVLRNRLGLIGARMGAARVTAAPVR